MNEELPKAWLPAESFAREEERRYLNLFAELIGNKTVFTSKFWRWGERDMYEQSIDARVSFGAQDSPATYLELIVHRRYHSMVQAARLEQIGFKRLQPTSTRWNREFRGNPSSEVVANYLFAGIKYLVDFAPDIGFKLAVEDENYKEVFESILAKYGAWNMPSTGDLTFINS
jgi:hypothetical protein